MPEKENHILASNALHNVFEEDMPWPLYEPIDYVDIAALYQRTQAQSSLITHGALRHVSKVRNPIKVAFHDEDERNK